MFPFPSWHDWKQFFKMLFKPPKRLDWDEHQRKSGWLLPEDMEREREYLRERFR